MDFTLPKDEIGNYVEVEGGLEKNMLAVLPKWMDYETRENGMKDYNDIMAVVNAHRGKFAQPDGLIYSPEKGFCCVQCNTMYVLALAETLARMNNQLYDEYRTIEAYLKQTALALFDKIESDGLLHNRFDADRPANPDGTARLAVVLLAGIRLRAIPRKYRARALALANGLDASQTDPALMARLKTEVAACSE